MVPSLAHTFTRTMLSCAPTAVFSRTTAVVSPARAAGRSGRKMSLPTVRADRSASASALSFAIDLATSTAASPTTRKARTAVSTSPVMALRSTRRCAGIPSRLIVRIYDAKTLCRHHSLQLGLDTQLRVNGFHVTTAGVDGDPEQHGDAGRDHASAHQ